MIRVARKIVFGMLLVAMVILVGMGLGTLVPRPFSVASAEQTQADATRRILVLSNPIHTDIALPADPDVLEALSFVSSEGLELDHPGVFWIILGWGSRSFYVETPTWAELKLKPVIDAFTWDRSVMHVRRTGDISAELDSVRVLELSQVEFATLLSEIRQSFHSETGESPRQIPGAAYDAHDIFFPAKGGFNAFLGCNTWTAQMLRKAGVTTGIWTPLPITLNWSLDLHNRF